MMLYEVYDVFPWVRSTEDAQEYDLISEVHGNSYFDINGHERWIPYGQVPCRSYINSNYIRSIHDEMIYDDEMTGYPCCTIQMDNGQEYFMACLWNQREAEAKLKEQEDDNVREGEADR